MTLKHTAETILMKVVYVDLNHICIFYGKSKSVSL